MGSRHVVHWSRDRGSLSPETIQLWLDEIAKHFPATAGLIILDLGSGTGRFTAPIALRLGAKVIGLACLRGPP